MNRTYTAKPSTIERKWYVVDATGVPIGRLASQVAQVLRGKHKPTFTYNMDCGDFVVVTNAEKAVWTGSKGKELIYWHTMYPGGIRNMSREDYLEKKPAELLEKVIWGMLPKTKLGKATYKKLKVYVGPDHPHAAQNPEPLNITQQP
ncbi:MAG: 50S ribosomal protein L13 [Fimbriimonadaceae bacterium]|nr:50S ribosomal protein L13 [Fimbriimonadaceae bacterium]QYK56780.1 MAG: 50S ribosomal protein L13 [Fimbriimonadaceae bacterium]